MAKIENRASCFSQREHLIVMRILTKEGPPMGGWGHKGRKKFALKRHIGVGVSNLAEKICKIW